ncbi:MAG: Plug domain-containing protein, partial [Nitrococcus sp.]|nr:Plug domain-containing protein [Nitrococcus sp.]
MRVEPIVLMSLLHLALVPAQAQEPDQKEQATTELPSMTVTGEQQPVATLGIEAAREEVKLTPGGVTLVDGEILRDRNISSLADMLRYVPGLYIQSDNGGDGIFFSSRGSNLDATDFDMNGIMLYQNGLPITTADGNNHNRIIDPLSTRYAIVARGANGMKYGASTLGGAINFINPTAYNMPGLRLYLNGGSFGQVQGRATVSKVFNNRFDGLLTVETKQRQG